MDAEADAGFAPPKIPGYVVGRPCGTGRTAQVYEARRDRDGDRCALKLVRLDAGSRETTRREIDVLTSVRAPGLIRLHEVVACDDGRLALVMDLVEGGTLREVVQARGYLVPREAVGVLISMARALAGLHAQGVAHGDVSAANVLVDVAGRAVLGDLGSARLATDEPSDVYGTTGYVAPEVVRGSEPCPATDVYALGALGWVMLTGRLPDFDLGEHAATPLGCPESLSDLLRSCLAEHPQERPTASALRRSLRDVGGSEPLTLPDGPGLGGLLTHRIRGAAATDVSSAAPGTSRGGTASDRRHRAPDIRARTPSRLLRLCAALTAPTTRAAGALGIGVGAGLALWAGFDTWYDAHGHAEAAVPDGSVVSAAPPHGPVTPDERDLRDELGPVDEHVAPHDPGSPVEPDPPHELGPQDEPREARSALPALLARRAQAFRWGDPALLDDVYVGATSAHSQARAEVERLITAGVRYAGLAYTVRDAQQTRDAGTSDADEARVRAVVDTGPYQVRGDQRRPSTNVPGRPGTPLVVTLRRTGDEWRIAEVEVA
ncbi:MAG: serine/threonine-protein kinase [Dermatophilaceae bacterium]